MFLHKEICWATEMKDDKVIDGAFDVPYVTTESDWGIHVCIRNRLWRIGTSIDARNGIIKNLQSGF